MKTKCKLIFVAASAFCINAFADEPMTLNNAHAAAAGSVPTNNAAHIQPADNQAQPNGQNIAQVQPNGQNALPVQPNGQNIAQTQPNGQNALPVQSNGQNAAPVNPDGSPLAAGLDPNGTPIAQLAQNDPNNTQNPAPSAENGEVDCSTVSLDQCGVGNQCKKLTGNTGRNGAFEEKCIR